MPYKIVQTIERGKITLTIVPSSWEQNGQLWWPPKKILNSLIKDDQSKPDIKEWKVTNCVSKRCNISTYQNAEAELRIMEENSDTDLNEIPYSPQTTSAVQNVETYEVLANSLIRNQECLGYSDNVVAENTITVTENTNDSETVQLISVDSINTILSNQKVLSDKLDKIVKQLATQSIQLEEISKELAELKNPSVTLLKDANPIDTESFSLKPIENQNDIIALDQLLLHNKAEKKKLQRHLSFLCSVSEGQGKTCAYKLLDILFTRDFLCNCSWAGGSRADVSKIALKDYKNVLKFFHSMIQTWDPSYTIQDNETFFKIITKNSKQRKAMKNLRMSSKRRRKVEKNDEKKETGESSKKREEESITSDDESGLC